MGRKPKREKQSIIPSEDQNKKRVMIERPITKCLECHEPAKYQIVLVGARDTSVYTFLCKPCKSKYPLEYVRDAIPNITRCPWDNMQVIAKEIGEI